MRDIKFTEYIKNDITERGEIGFNSLKIVPNREYSEMEFHSVFNFRLDSDRRELDIYLLYEETENIDDYPFQLFIKQNSTGEVNFKINAHMAKRATDILKFNNMMYLWSEKGLRRLRIHKAKDCKAITIVPDKIDADKIEYVTILKEIMDKTELNIDEIPNIKSKKLVDRICKLQPSKMDKSDCKRLISEVQNDIYKEQTNVLILLKSEDEKILLSRRICVLPYFIDLDFINVKSSNKEGKELLKKAFNREIGISLEKFIFGNSIKDYFNEIVDIFKNDRSPFYASLSKIFSGQGTSPIGRCLLKISNETQGHWNKEQNISFIIEYADKEINKSMKLDDLLSAGNFIDAISLMQQDEDKHLENLAFAYYLKKDYKTSLDYSKRAIEDNFYSVAHFTMGLVFLSQGKFDEAYESYMNGIYLIKSDIWYPVIKDNIKLGIESGQINDNDKIKDLVNTIEMYRRRTHSKIIKSCFCSSKKHYFECHGKEYKL